MAKQTKMVLVQWDDCSTVHGWHDRRLAEDYGDQTIPCWTVGFVLKRTRKALILSPTLGPDQVADVWRIPKSQIVHVAEIGHVETPPPLDTPL